MVKKKTTGMHKVICPISSRLFSRSLWKKN